MIDPPKHAAVTYSVACVQRPNAFAPSLTSAPWSLARGIGVGAAAQQCGPQALVRSTATPRGMTDQPRSAQCCTMEAGLYVHVPYCVRKCAYCDFNSYAIGRQHTQPYVEALLAEFRLVQRWLGVTGAIVPAFGTAYFGGGTPTTVPAAQLGSVLRALTQAFPLAQNPEITVEANPGTIDRAYLEELRRAGFNRLSFGVQCLNDRLLKAIGRIHTAQEAVDGVRWAREAGFDNLSIDLIYALPGQTVADWRDTLERAMALQPDHISLYSLMVEPGTPFWRMLAKNRLNLPDEDAELEMDVLAQQVAEQHGYERYEVSNYAKPGFRSRHNQVYWHNGPYLGFGAGAASYWDGERRTNVRLPKAYIQRVAAGELPVEDAERLEPRRAAGEMVMLGLRLLDGLDVREVRDRFGVDVLWEFREHVRRMSDLGLLEVRGTRLRLTEKGLPLANEVWSGFVI